MIPPRSPRSARSHAFSAPELLVVVAGISVLGLLLSTGLARGGVESRTAACLANLQSLGRAWAMYAADHEGLLVNNYTIPNIQDTVARRTYRTWANNILDWTTSRDNTNVSLVATGRLSAYLESSVAVFKCPADTFTSAPQTRLGWTGRVRSYSMNGFLGAAQTYAGGDDSRGVNLFYPAYRQFRQMSGMPNPAGIFVLLEEHPDSINDGYYFVTPGTASSWMDLPAAHHDGGANFSFADGHVEAHAWLAPTNLPGVRFSYTPVPLRGAGKDDYAWVAGRQTVPVMSLASSRQASGDGGLRIAWSQLTATHVLQRSPDMNPASWTNVPTPPVKSMGQWSVDLGPAGAQGFFRLARP